MSDMANIVAFDGQATPVSHTFGPISVSREGNKITASYREDIADRSIDGQPTLVLTLEKLKSGVYRVEQRLVVPVMEALASGETVYTRIAYFDTVVSTAYFSPQTQTVGRRATRHLAANLLAGLTATSAAVTTGNLPEIFDKLVSPT